MNTAAIAMNAARTAYSMVAAACSSRKNLVIIAYIRPCLSVFPLERTHAPRRIIRGALGNDDYVTC